MNPDGQRLLNQSSTTRAHPGCVAWINRYDTTTSVLGFVRGVRDQLLPGCIRDAFSLTDPDASRLQRRYQKHRQSLFVFLYRSDVSPTNNISERALRPSVIHRKVIGCFCSKWGDHAYAALATVIDTAELNGIHAFAAIQSLFARPSLPLPIRV